MADQMRTTPDPDSEREVDWGERLLASMNETSAEADEPTEPVFDEEDDLAALLRAQLARQKEDPTPDLLDTAEFEEDEDEEPIDEEELDEEDLDEEELDEEDLDEEELDEEDLDEEELDEEEFDEEELDEEELDEEELDEEEFDEEGLDEEEFDEEGLDEEEFDEEEFDEEEFDEEELDEKFSEQALLEEKFKELFVTEEPGESIEVYPEDDYAEDDYVEDEYTEEEDEEEPPVSAEDILPDNTLNGSAFCESGDDVSAMTSMQNHSQNEALRAVLAENTQILEEEQERREAAIHGLADPSSEANVDISNVAAIVHNLPAEEPKDDEDVFASRHRAQPRSSVIGYDPLQIGHGGSSARVVADILDGELPVGAYAKPETERTDYTAKMVGTSEADVHLRDTALWMDMGYGADVRHAEERRVAERVRSTDAPVSASERNADNSTAEKVRAAREELESARKAYPKTRIFAIARLIAAFVGALIAVLYGSLPVVEQSISDALSPVVYPLLGLLWMILIALPFVTRLVRGVMGLVRFAPTRYSVTVISMAVAFCYAVISMIACAIAGVVLPSIEGIPLCMLAFAALSELFETFGAGNALSVVSSGRAVYVLSDGETPAATTLPEYTADELIPRRKRPRPLTALRTTVVDHTVARMKQYNPYMSRLNYLLPAALGTALVIACVALLRGGHILTDGVRVFAVTYLAALPAAYLIAMSLPLHIANGRMRTKGCAIVSEADPETYARSQTKHHKCEFLIPERDVIMATRRKEITLREDDPTAIDHWRCVANRFFHLLDIPLATDTPFEDDQSPEALAHLHVEISDTDVHYMKAYLVNDTPDHPETTEIVMGSHDALSRRGIRLPKRAMESVYRKSEDSHVVYLAFNGRFRLAYAVEYRVDPAFLDTMSRLGDCGMRPVMVSYDPMLTSAMLIEPRFAALGNIEVVRPDYTDVKSTLCSSGVVAMHGSRDLVYPLIACRRIHVGYRLSHAMAWVGYAAVSALSLIAVLAGGNAYVNTATAVGAQAILAALFVLLSWIVVYRPAFKTRVQRLIARITKK